MAINPIKRKKAKRLGMIPTITTINYGKKRVVKSQYALNLIERKKLLLTYNIKAHQLKTMMNNFDKTLSAYEYVYINCESMLSNVVYRLGFARSPRGAGQLISHKNILVNNIVMAHKMYRLKVGDVISVSENLMNNTHINESIKKNKYVCSHIKSNGLSGEFVSLPSIKEMYLTKINFGAACSSELRF